MVIFKGLGGAREKSKLYFQGKAKDSSKEVELISLPPSPHKKTPEHQLLEIEGSDQHH